MSALQRRLAQLRCSVVEIDVMDVPAFQRAGGLLVDIRESDEIAAGSPVSARRIARGFLEIELERDVPLETPIAVMCAAGTRSLLAADGLMALGFADVRSVLGGFGAWREKSLPWATPPQLTADQRQRYARHLSIPEVGLAGQHKLLNARVLLIGAGGLGSPCALYLAAAGVGTLGLVDDDVVDRSNLQRQVLHTEARIGQKKVESARQTLLALNSGLKVQMHDERLSAENVEAIFSGYDIVVDGTDNFGARYLINDASVRLGLPNVHAAVFRFEGYVTVFSPQLHQGPCYRCLHAAPPPSDLAPSCAEAGVLGVLPGVIGTLQAVEVIKLLLGIGTPLVGRVLSYDALKAEFSEYEVERVADCKQCGIGAARLDAYREIEPVCTIA